jgi:hypothetical protein
MLKPHGSSRTSKYPWTRWNLRKRNGKTGYAVSKRRKTVLSPPNRGVVGVPNHVSIRNWVLLAGVIVFLGLNVFGGFEHMWDFIVDKLNWLFTVCTEYFKSRPWV